MSRIKRLIAVPPWRAKHFSFATSGNTLNNSDTCCLYSFSMFFQFSRNGYLIFIFKNAVFDQATLTLSQIYTAKIKSIEPIMIGLFRQVKEQAFYFHRPAAFQQCLNLCRHEII